MPFRVGETVLFAGIESVVGEPSEREGRVGYLIENGSERIPMWVPEDILEAHQRRGYPAVPFEPQTPSLVVVDDFFNEPYEIRDIALHQDYVADLRHYKGLRSTQRFLWPYLREEFGRLLGRPVSEWFAHLANGVFQQTKASDPLVWHADTQDYAGAVYLTPDAPLDSGTSFWRDRKYGCRRDPTHPREQKRLGSPESATKAEAQMFKKANMQNPESWEFVESVSGVFNRLVLWDAKLIHSASSYEPFEGQDKESTRLAQLFFFDIG